MFAVKIFALFSLFVSCVVAVTTKERLVGDLMRGYMREVDPGTTPLHMSLSYICANLNTDTNLLSSKLLEQYSWEDTRLRWTPSHYEGLEHIRLPAKLIWNPDLKLYNAHAEPEIRDDVNTVIFSNGTVLWIPMVQYKTRCTPNGDEAGSALCKLHIGSWTYDANNLNLQLSGTGFDTYMYLDTCPYIITEPTAEVESKVYPCCTEPYSSMHVSFKLTPRE